MTVTQTERLVLRHFTPDDAAFILRLLNEPSFLHNIGDRGVRTLDDARKYLDDGPMASYARHGHGLWLAALKGTGEPIGMCGLLKRDHLPHPDIGYALLPEFCSRGYASEAASAVLELGWRELGLARILAIVSPANAASIRLLENLGFTPAGTAQAQPGGADSALYELHRPDWR
jgi:RimJ/RimL family protein N-acetyltransferase